MKKPSSLSKLLLAAISIIGCFAVVSQFILIMQNGKGNSIELFIRFFSYFTILTNLLVTVCCTALLLKPNSYFNKQQTLAAITVYIFIVGLVYNLVLRSIWSPIGLQKLVDELLHSVIPTSFLLFWLLFVNKQQLQWKHIFVWLLYPLCYCLFILIRGHYSNFYPYPFMDVTALGWQNVMVNSIAVMVAFIAVSALVIGLGKKLK